MGAILSKAWDLYKARLGACVAISLLTGLVLAAVAAGGSGIAMGAAVLPGRMGVDLVKAGLFFAGLGALLTSAWTLSALCRAFLEPELSIGQALLKARADAGTMALTLLFAAALIGCGVPLLGFPAVIFAVWFSLCPFVVACEGEWGLEALSRSRECLRGKWWLAASCLGVCGALSAAAALIPVTGPLLSAALAPLPLAAAAALYGERQTREKASPGVPAKLALIGWAAICLASGPIFLSVAVRRHARSLQSRLVDLLQSSRAPEPEPAPRREPKAGEALYKELARAYISAAAGGKEVTIIGLGEVTIADEGSARVTYQIEGFPPHTGRFGFSKGAGPGDWQVRAPSTPEAAAEPAPVPALAPLGVAGTLAGEEFRPDTGEYVIIQSMSRVNLLLSQSHEDFKQERALSIRISDAKKEVLAGQTLALGNGHLVRAPSTGTRMNVQGCSGTVTFGPERALRVSGTVKLICTSQTPIDISGSFDVPILWH